MTQQKNSPGELAHYGVKGMKWGVKKARTGQLDDQARFHEKVASGKANLLERHNARMSNPIGVARRGLQQQSALTAKSNRAEIDRLATGKATTGDILRAYKTTNVADLIRSRKDDNSQEDRINKRVKAGQTRAQAEKSDRRKQALIATAVTGAYFITKALIEQGAPVASQKTAQRAQTNRDRATAAGSRGLPRKATNGPTYSKLHNGAFKISSL